MPGYTSVPGDCGSGDVLYAKMAFEADHHFRDLWLSDGRSDLCNRREFNKNRLDALILVVGASRDRDSATNRQWQMKRLARFARNPA